jgi:hypothetical protein
MLLKEKFAHEAITTDRHALTTHQKELKNSR